MTVAGGAAGRLSGSQGATGTCGCALLADGVVLRFWQSL